ncbi:hypothetical protein BVRB_8g184520 [Beta vulgaris subsp. vulgaris]|uniref:gibberellin-regulated protein 2 n=1 Tax=Beta vulgaris subsp. vulgaris TaxID=3555 RepID=UPI00053F5D16|nr:gibberellin-regulated protein 2 [Beta vulgaris subsp. vulgaris]KMT04381.1 hypothetical protein BVRB_8g184520 [Beta vulgaris subsp. vulgaris]
MCNFNRILLLAIAIFCLVVSHQLEVCRANPQQPAKGAFLGAKIDCKGKCHIRCSVASRYRICIRTCNTCCQRCNCVPPGTSGNANVCPCWDNMTTKGGRKKCP